MTSEKGDSSEQIKYTQEFNKNYIIWDAKPENEKYVSEQSESSQIQLRPTMKQKIENSYEKGSFILSVGSWWEEGDIFFDILVQVQP